MGRRKHPARVAVEGIVTRILATIDSNEPFSVRTLVRNETPRPYLEVRVTSPALYDACRSEDKDYIFRCIRAVVPGVIGVYEKGFVRENTAGQNNKVVLHGLMIHIQV